MLFTQNINLTDTAVTEVLKVPDGFIGKWTLTFVSNLDNANNHLTMFVDKASSDPDLYLLNDKIVNSKDYLIIETRSGIVLQPGDVLKASTDTVGNVEVVVTLDLIYSPFNVNNFGTGGA